MSSIISTSGVSLPKATRRGSYKRNDKRIADKRNAIIESAAVTIGEYGYAETSISRITEGAGISQGTFYKYFASRQELFDIVLPAYADRMLDFIREVIPMDLVGLDREMERMKAFLAFVKSHSWFVRLVNEASVQAPEAYKAYFEKVVTGYVRLLDRAVGRGEIVGYTESQLEAVSIALLAVRGYYAQVFLDRIGHAGEADSILDGYRAFIERALFTPPQ